MCSMYISHLSVTSIVGVSKERIEYEKSVSNCSNISSDQKQEQKQELSDQKQELKVNHKSNVKFDL
jgi:hypothetical protein